jgi:hypothetical protein
MGLPTIRNIEAAEQLFDMLGGWQLANDTIADYFNNHPAWQRLNPQWINSRLYR